MAEGTDRLTQIAHGILAADRSHPIVIVTSRLRRGVCIVRLGGRPHPLKVAVLTGAAVNLIFDGTVHGLPLDVGLTGGGQIIRGSSKNDKFVAGKIYGSLFYGTIAPFDGGLQPLGLCPSIVNDFQTVARSKCIGIDQRDTIWDRHTGQAFASRECTTPNTGHTFRNRHTGQLTAVFKCPIQDNSHTLRNRYTGQVAAAGKCRASNECHAVRNRHTDQTAAAPKCLGPDTGHAGLYNNSFNITFFITP